MYRSPSTLHLFLLAEHDAALLRARLALVDGLDLDRRPAVLLAALADPPPELAALARGCAPLDLLALLAQEVLDGAGLLGLGGVEGEAGRVGGRGRRVEPVEVVGCGRVRVRVRVRVGEEGEGDGRRVSARSEGETREERG